MIKQFRVLILMMVVLLTSVPVFAQKQEYNDPVIQKAVTYIKSLQTGEGNFGKYDGHYYLAASLGQAGEELKSYIDYLKTLTVDSNTSAGELAKLIYTLSSIGENPSDFNGKDIVKILLDKQQKNGSFGAGEAGDAFIVVSINQAGIATPKQTQMQTYFEGLTYENGLFKYPTGTDIDTTARIVRALKILGADNNHPIIKNALDAIHKAQNENGVLESWGAPNYDSTAEVVMMLVDLGIDPTAGEWDKNGKNLITAIVDNQDKNGSFKGLWDAKYSSYEALLALFKYYQTFNRTVADKDSKHNSVNSSNVNNDSDKSVNITVSVIGKNGEILFPKTEFTLSEVSKYGKTVLQTLEQTGLSFKTKNDNSYISEIVGLKESISSTAGWKYKVNGVSPSVSAVKCILKDGDVVELFWVDNYMQDQSKNKDNKPSIFKDVTNENFGWAKEEIEYLADKGIISGDGKSKFNPGKSITREEYIKIIITMLGVKVGNKENSGFKDDGLISNWAKPYITKAKEMEIIDGYGDNVFKPKGKISREEMVVIFVKALIRQGKTKLENVDDQEGLTFSDKDKISKWAKKYIMLAVKNNMLKGNEENKFNAKGMGTRAEVAIMIYRIVDMGLKTQN